MPIYVCESCGNDCYWEWEEAFDKFGFNDGDSDHKKTNVVIEMLVEAGFEAESAPFGYHNEVVCSIKKNGEELLPHKDENFKLGYDNPRDYLPIKLIELLDERFRV